jgi:predicted nucleic acid-binding protein
MQIQGSKRQLVPLSSEITVEAGLLERPEISVTDMIIAAPAWSAGAAVVTNDPHFRQWALR